MYRILMVDDDPMILENNQTFFCAMGYDVICADTAAAAEEIILTNALDCVILDVDLPDMDGFVLCEKIRSKTGLPIVFLSGYTEEESRIRGLSVGGDDYVCKPYSLKELELRVHCCLANRVGQKKKRLKNAGAKYAEQAAVSKLDVIADDPKLRIAFDSIVKKLEAKYIQGDNVQMGMLET